MRTTTHAPGTYKRFSEAKPKGPPSNFESDNSFLSNKNNEFISSHMDGRPTDMFAQRSLFRIPGNTKNKHRILPYLSSVVGMNKTKQPLVDSSLFQWSWILYILLLCGNAALIVVIGLDVVGIGPGLPLLDIIAHFVLFVAFAALFIYAVIQLGKEMMLGDRMGLVLVTFHSCLYNFVLTFVFLSWILNNTSQHAEVKYADNMQAYSSFIGICVWSSVWFFVTVVNTCLVIGAKYLKRKIEEIIDETLSVQNKHLEQLHDTSLPKLVNEIKKMENPLPSIIQTYM